MAQSKQAKSLAEKIPHEYRGIMFVKKPLPEGAKCPKCGGYMTRVADKVDKAEMSRCLLCGFRAGVKSNIMTIDDYGSRMATRLASAEEPDYSDLMDIARKILGKPPNKFKNGTYIKNKKGKGKKK